MNIDNFIYSLGYLIIFLSIMLYFKLIDKESFNSYIDYIPLINKIPDNPVSTLVVMFIVLYCADRFIPHINYLYSIFAITIGTLFIWAIYLFVLESAGKEKDKKKSMYINGAVWTAVFYFVLFSLEVRYDEYNNVIHIPISEYFNRVIYYIAFIEFAVYRSFVYHKN